jgi:hypothetical protein
MLDEAKTPNDLRALATPYGVASDKRALLEGSSNVTPASLISQSTSGWSLSPLEEQNEKLQLINDIYAEVPSI